MREIPLSADDLIKASLNLTGRESLCLLDSSDVSHLGSHLLIAGFRPAETLELNEENPAKTLEILDRKLSNKNLAAIFTISYEFGLKLENIRPRPKKFPAFGEPDVFLALFDALVVHDYKTHKTFLVGDEKRFSEMEESLFTALETINPPAPKVFDETIVSSNFTSEEYISAVEEIREAIRAGETYQANLTRQIRARLPAGLAPEQIFLRLRENHPAPFAAFLRRSETTIVSASPERFFATNDERRTTNNEQRRIQNSKFKIIKVSPIKGTRPRGRTAEEDSFLRNELLNSAKDRAENVMIVDLLRNDIGRICEYGSVRVEKLCDLETHPSLYHLVSTVSGELRGNANFSDILRAAFPCGSITGAPKISTMRIIDRLETAPRGLSMGAIGYSIQGSKFAMQNSTDLSVAIRTMVIKEREAIFNVGGGVTIDSDPAEEYAETETKARALLAAIGSRP